MLFEPVPKRPSLPRVLAGALAFGVLGLAANLFPIALLPNVQMLLGPIAVLAAAVLLGPIGGGVAGAISATVTVALWNHPWAWIGFTLEGVIVGHLARKRLPLVADALYWLFGIAYLSVTYGIAAKTTGAALVGVILKQAINGLTAALVVQVALTVPAVRRAAIRLVQTPLRDMSLAATLVSALALSAVAPTMVLTARDGHVRYTRDIARVDDVNAETARATVAVLSEALDDATREVSVFAGELTQSGPVSHEELDARLRRMLTRTPEFLNAYVADENAVAIAFFAPSAASDAQLVGHSFADRAYVHDVRTATGTIVSDVFGGRAGTTLPLVVTLAPVRRNGSFAGYVLGAFDVRSLAQRAARLAMHGQRILVADRHGTVVLDSAEAARDGVVRTIEGSALAAALTKGSVGTYIPAQVIGVPAARVRDERRFAAASVERLGWRVIVERPSLDVQRAIESTYVSALLTLLVVVALIGFAALALVRTLLHPVTAVCDRAAQLAAGDLDARVGEAATGAPRELRALGDAFDAMAASVRAHVDELGRASRAKDEFLSLASHELKTPLTALKMRVHSLRRKVDVEVPAMQAIDRQIDRLTELIDRLLDASRVALGALSVERRAVALDALVRRVAEPIVELSGSHRVSLDIEPVLGAFDEVRIEQVVHNLLSNALKYSPAGGEVTVKLERVGDDAVLTVEDRGVGVGEDSAPLFERFRRGARGVAAGVAGLGVGLYVSREIVRGHGGDITLVDRDGGGSVARVVLPIGER